MTLDTLTLDCPYLVLDDEFYDRTEPQPLDDPWLVSFSPDAARLIGLGSECRDDPRLVHLLNGTFLPEGAEPFAMCYAGHQFGNYAARLGDGRAHNLGRVNGWNLQLKGSGETLYSRMGDGRAALRSSIREYLMSEAMHHLGIPTTRALGIIGSQTKILRSGMEQSAVVMRMATSWVRFGTFEYFYYVGEHAKLEALAEYVIDESYPHLKGDEDRYFKLFGEIVDRTALLIAQWQGVGFNHGVMNTDNMSVEGLTIDYGPYAMLDDFDYGNVCNQTDRVGRYSYGDQPNISYWNLTMLSKAFSPLVDKTRLQQKLDDYGAFIYPDAYIDEMCRKLGLEQRQETDVELVTELVGALQDCIVDHTLFFRTLSRYDGERQPLRVIVSDREPLEAWLDLYDDRLMRETRPPQARRDAMLRTNPKYILKNYMLQEAIDLALEGDYSLVETLLEVARHPFDERPEFEHFARETPFEHKNLRLSCSS
jgi:serine/tyrosine/threonine adenylyltransferase